MTNHNYLETHVLSIIFHSRYAKPLSVGGPKTSKTSKLQSAVQRLLTLAATPSALLLERMKEVVFLGIYN